MKTAPPRKETKMRLHVANELDKLISNIDKGITQDDGRDLIRAFSSLEKRIDRIVKKAERKLR